MRPRWRCGNSPTSQVQISRPPSRKNTDAKIASAKPVKNSAMVPEAPMAVVARSLWCSVIQARAVLAHSVIASVVRCSGPCSSQRTISSRPSLNCSDRPCHWLATWVPMKTKMPRIAATTITRPSAVATPRGTTLCNTLTSGPTNAAMISATNSATKTNSTAMTIRSATYATASSTSSRQPNAAATRMPWGISSSGRTRSSCHAAPGPRDVRANP